jgi:putative N6-adenine-specific DNA methylase
MEFFATASAGTEKALQRELIELGFKSVRLNSGGIPFLGDISEGWRACLSSRIAQRVQLVLGRFSAPDEKSLYDGVKAFEWSRYLTVKHTLSVSSFCNSSNITHSGYIAQKVKDAIVDNLRELHGTRPDVDRSDPDLRVFLYLANNKATLYLDLSGTPLFQRGYRLEKGEAPLKETIAAAMIMYSGWDRCSSLWDPMCGSGTIAIEAALWARNIAPGIFKERFGFERWADFNDLSAEIMREMRGKARRNANGTMPSIIASDHDPLVLEIAKSNARRAGVRISFREGKIENIEADGARRTVITNPPFDQRLAVDKDFYRRMGAAFSRLHGSRIALLSSNPLAGRSIPAKEIASYKLKNGDLDCLFLTYDVP